MKNLHNLATVISAVFSWSLLCTVKVDSVNINDELENYSGSEPLGDKIMLEWTVNSEENAIYFELTAETKGYLGFGISPNGGMKGSDILIAGVNQDGSIYFSDRHGVGNSEPVEDMQQNWEVSFGEEVGSKTKLRFSRLLNTCDEDDLEITDSTMRLIWALGDTDTITYHNTLRGTKSLNFFLKPNHDSDYPKYEQVSMTAKMKMPTQHTTYWCTIHKAPPLKEKRHIVAIEPVLEETNALHHTHHFIIYRCLTDNPAAEQILEMWVGHEGDYCYGSIDDSFPFQDFCIGYLLYGWSRGGRPLVFPSEVGLPIAEDPYTQEYYALEVHMDNPQMLANIEFTTGARFFLAPKLRSVEAGFLLIGHQFDVGLTIPPDSTNFVVAGHCSSPCTDYILPEDGITIFNNLFHSHLAGKRLRLRHFRGDEELALIDEDKYYDFDYQQNRPLVPTRKVEKGDQLTVECEYDSTLAEGGKAVIGGLSTSEEMCQSFVYYYPRTQFVYCASGQDLDKHFRLLGMTKYSKEDSSYPGGIQEYEIVEPKNLAGKYLESVSSKVTWTQEFRDLYQKEKRYGMQQSYCNLNTPLPGVLVGYPENLKEYQPPNECLQPTTTTKQSNGSIVLYSQFLTAIMILTSKVL